VSDRASTCCFLQLCATICSTDVRQKELLVTSFHCEKISQHLLQRRCHLDDCHPLFHQFRLDSTSHGTGQLRLDFFTCLADRMEGRPSEGNRGFVGSVEHLDRTLRTCCSGKSQEMVAAQFGAFLFLSRRIESPTISLDKEIVGRLGLIPI
jgi:hypothetical protein